MELVRPSGSLLETSRPCLSKPRCQAFPLGSVRLGMITSLTDPNGNAWQRGFDKQGRLVSSSDPLGRTSSIAYDSRQRPSKITLPLGSVQLGYGPTGNLLALSYSDGPILSFNYDADNRLTGANGVTLSYDAAGR